MAFMSSLDSSIVNIALPTLTQSLNEPISTTTWVVTSYLIAICAMMLLFGRMGDIKGNTRIFRLGIVVFTCGSLLCGISVNLPMLIISRVIQATGAASAMATNQGIITQTFPKSERGRALGFNGTSVAIGSLLGPPLGGFIVAALSWHFIFLINIPIGIFVFLRGRKILPKSYATEEKLDLKGVVLFALSAILIFCAVGVGDTIHFSSPLIIPPIIAGVLLLAVFIIVERRQNQPMLDLSIFKNGLFSISIVCVLLVYAALNSINIIQPFYLQSARNLNSFTAGLIMMVYPVVLGVSSPLSGYLSDRIGQKLPTLIGLCLSTLAYIGAALMTLDTSLALTCVIYGFLGVGNALFMSPNTSLIMSTVPPSKLGVAGSINSLCRNMGFIFGVLTATTVLFSSMSSKYGQPVNDYIQGRPDLFIYGMRTTYFVFAGVCFAAVLVTAVRLFAWGNRKTETV